MVDITFLKYSQKVFKLFRLWPHNPGENKTVAVLFGKLMIFLFAGVFLTLISVLDMIETIKHEELTQTFCKALYVLACVAAGHKLFIASFNADAINDCIKQLEDLSKRFKDTTDIEECLRLYDKLFIVGASIVVIGLCLFATAPLTSDIKRPLIFTPHVKALNLEATPNWQLFYLSEVVALCILTTVMISLDTLFCGMINVCSGILSSISKEIRELDDIIEDHQTLDQQMKETIQKLIDITQLTTRISDTFSSSTMVHITLNCITIALTLFMSRVLPLSLLFFSTITVVILISFQLWTYCYFGQNLVDQREVLQRELYFTRWYDGSKNFKTMLLLTIFEMQNDRYVYAGKIIPLSLETFSMVIKRAYTFFTFLAEAR